MFVRKERNIVLVAALSLTFISHCQGFAPTSTQTTSTTSLNGLFDNWSAGGSGKDDLDDQWEKQQEILKFRRSSNENKAKYFSDVSVFINANLYTM